MGRFSNGPIWVDFFAALLGRPADAAPVFLQGGASGNYAVGGARTVNTGPVPPQSPSTQLQIARYLTSTGGLTDPTGLYVLFAGGNDLRDIAGLPDPTLRAAQTIATAQRLAAQAGLLAAAGAHSILLPYLGNLAFLPESQMIPGRATILNQLSPLFNETLSGQIALLRGQFPQTTIFPLRVDQLFAAILADAQTGGTRYGITNVTIPCFAPGAPSCNVSLFVDPLHPTTKAHQILASAAFNLVTGQSVAPEPATTALVAGGLVLLAVGARRRRWARRAA
jgi:outer membrane lipase/esterase